MGFGLGRRAGTGTLEGGDIFHDGALDMELYCWWHWDLDLVLGSGLGQEVVKAECQWNWTGTWAVGLGCGPLDLG